MRRIGLLGLSGVGKSTLLKAIASHVDFMHLQASDLIKAELQFRADQPQSSEDLRTGAVVENQALLISGFNRAVEHATVPIVFDGHSIIDGRDGLIEIPSEVFAALGLAAICFLEAEPSVIATRRCNDARRQRPNRNVDVLRGHQAIAQAAARRIAYEIGCPFRVISDDEHDLLRQLISQD
ncbi:AAA family ATPase [Sphingomonas sp.]|uniref:ATP-binding protein n=1 Tax=Sphingomonas sp. TaxID=28214 RepID=UPI0025F82D91|nr:AAA family ATPase [Sphingomonas sp.]